MLNEEGGIDVDGSRGEGGGQILRGAVAFSALTGRSVRIYNIRAGRAKPGLQPQHLVSMQAAAEVTGSSVSGLEVGSSEVGFTPGAVRTGRYEFDIKTAGSITMVIQTLLPILAFSNGESEVTIEGGTDVPWSPQLDYVREIMIPGLRTFGVNASLELIRRGHYPRGGGKASLRVKGVPRLTAVKAVERGKIDAVRGVSHCTNLPDHVAKRQSESALRFLKGDGIENIHISQEVSQTGTGGPGSGIVLWAETGSPFRIGADSLGAKGKRAEVVGSEAAEGLMTELRSGMALDKHMGDMAVIYMAVADGTSEVGVSSMTRHTETMLWLSEAFLRVKWQVGSRVGGGTTIRVEGAGLGRTI